MKSIIIPLAATAALSSIAVDAELVVLQDDPKWCIGAKAIIQGGKLKLYECDASSPLQNWTTVPSSLGGLTWKIGDDLCVEATQLDQDNKKLPRLDFCITSKKQRWMPDYGRDATQSIQSAKKMDLCVAYSGDTPENGRNIKLLSCEAAAAATADGSIAKKQAWLWMGTEMYEDYVQQLAFEADRPEGIADLSVAPALSLPCPRDAKRCSDLTTTVTRDPKNSCEFRACPEDDGSNQNNAGGGDGLVMCTMDVRMCPDGKTYLSRTGPDCQFPECPPAKPGISNNDVTPETINIQKSVWDSNFSDGWPRDYSFDYTVQCFCQPDWTRKRTVTVIDGQVAEVLYADTLEPVPDNIASGQPTIDAVLKELSGLSADKSMQGGKGMGKFDVEWDKQYGYPKRLSVDRSEMIADDERTTIIENVQIS